MNKCNGSATYFHYYYYFIIIEYTSVIVIVLICASVYPVFVNDTITPSSGE